MGPECSWTQGIEPHDPFGRLFSLREIGGATILSEDDVQIIKAVLEDNDGERDES